MRALNEKEKAAVRKVAEAHDASECCDRWTHVVALAGELLFDVQKAGRYCTTELEAQQAALWELAWTGQLTVLSPQVKAQVKGALQMTFSHQAREAVMALEYLS